MSPQCDGRSDMLQNQIDGLFMAVEQHLDSFADSRRYDDGMGFKVALVGDSTMVVRATWTTAVFMAHVLKTTWVVDRGIPSLEQPLDNSS